VSTAIETHADQAKACLERDQSERTAMLVAIDAFADRVEALGHARSAGPTPETIGGVRAVAAPVARRPAVQRLAVSSGDDPQPNAPKLACRPPSAPPSSSS